MKVVVFVSCLTVIVSIAHGYSGGAPAEVCDDMTPKHPVEPQKSAFPYSVTANKNDVKAGEKVDFVIGGGNFKGFLLEVRSGDKAVGSFDVADTDKFVKTINCHGSQKSGATHKNSIDKKNLKVTWVAPSDVKGNLNVYATVAKDGGVFWVAQKQAQLKVN